MSATHTCPGQRCTERWYQRTRASGELPNGQRPRLADGGSQASGRSLSVTELNSNGLPLSQYLPGPHHVAPEHTHAPLAFASSTAVPPLKPCTPRMGGEEGGQFQARVTWRIAALCTFFCRCWHLPSRVSRCISGCTRREADKRRTMESAGTCGVETTQE